MTAMGSLQPFVARGINGCYADKAFIENHPDLDQGAYWPEGHQCAKSRDLFTGTFSLDLVVGCATFPEDKWRATGVKRFQEKVVLVTGAGTGIGLACAQRLAGEGATVVAAIQNESQTQAVSEMNPQVLDVCDESSWQTTLRQIETSHGGLDVLVNNAGVHDAATTEETSLEQWKRTIDTNLFGTFLGCKSVLPSLRRRGGGAIVNLGSYASHRGVRSQVAYATSKGGILAMTLAIAADHVSENIRVNCVCPAATDTPIIKKFADKQPDAASFLEQMSNLSPMGRMATPEEVAASVAFLASDDASYLTGVALPIDGGRSSF